MKSRLNNSIKLITLFAFIINALSLPAMAQQQRSRRVSESASFSLPAGTRLLPRGLVIVVRLETQLDSGKSRPSDRFYARIEETVVDERGAMILPKNLLLLGHVTEVSPAQMRRRSGLIEIAFDKLVMADGRELPIRGNLTSADAEERKNLRLDEEGVIEGGSQMKRNTVFIGGGATAGAVVGAIAGGAALGAGVGAAAGLIAVLLAKGKEAVVEPGTLVGLELTEALDLTQRGIAPPPVIPSPSPNSTNKGSGTTSTPNYNPQEPTTPQVPIYEPQPLKLSFVQAERVSGGSILVVATVETPSSGWRVKSEQQVKGDLLEIWVKGTPPEGRASHIVSHPTVTASTPDPRGVIRRVLVHGLGIDKSVVVPQRATR